MEETTVNFLGGSPLNRLSWLRSSTTFFEAVVDSPESRWLLFNTGQPLVQSNTDGKATALARLTTDDVRPLLGPFPVFGQGRKPGENVGSEHSPHTEAARLYGARVVFLGLHEPENAAVSALPSSDFSAKTDPSIAVTNVNGTPYFAMDVSDTTSETLEMALKSSKTTEEGSLEFMESRSASAGFTAFDAAIFAEARSMIDWNTRNKYCPGCGSPTYSLWAGWKLACSTLLPWADNTDRKECPSAKGVHNYSHPRTDAVVIMAIIDESGDKILLGRNRKFPNGFYSTLAGFMEPGESFEDAVKREIWEESGVRVWGVKYHSGQPWPYPASLMVGFYAFADATKPVRLDLDNELVDARWFTRDEVNSVLAHAQGSTIRRAEYRKFDDDDAKPSTEKEVEKDASGTTAAAQMPSEPTAPPPFRVPPTTAIAGILIRDWASGVIGRGGSKAPQQRGNL